ncbi:MAG: hypothetical protein E7505_00075 [Ruminococcus sp.]|nr:hypothetical protein [Ruminococcus sp.]
MSKTITISENKNLKLTNVVIREINFEEDIELNTVVLQMENYIKAKGAVPLGPLVQKTVYSIDDTGQLDIHMYIMRQANNFINNVESPYTTEAVLRVKNCMYARYIGPEENLKFAYDKINVTAFEEDIELSNENYTIFVDQQDDEIIADIFVEKKSNE